MERGDKGLRGGGKARDRTRERDREKGDDTERIQTITTTGAVYYHYLEGVAHAERFPFPAKCFLDRAV